MSIRQWSPPSPSGKGDGGVRSASPPLLSPESGDTSGEGAVFTRGSITRRTPHPRFLTFGRTVDHRPPLRSPKNGDTSGEGIGFHDRPVSGEGVLMHGSNT